jgi:hypothetical protein
MQSPEANAAPDQRAGRGAELMATRTKSKVTPKYKTKYRVKNWPAYEAALRKRGDVTLWFDQEAIDAWNAPATGRPGGQPVHQRDQKVKYCGQGGRY